MRFLISSLMVIVLSGCVSTMDKIAGIGQVEESVSTFDGAKVITLSKSNTYNGSTWSFPNTRLGAKWVSSNPDSVVMFLIHESTVSSGNAYVNYEGVKINIGGNIKEFKSVGLTDLDSSGYNTVSNTIYTKSTGAVIVPLDYLKKMVESDDVKLRVLMMSTYEDIIFSIDNAGATKYARANFKEFLKQVSASAS